MTKISSLFILFGLLLSLNVSAQQKSRLGIKTGVNFAWHTDGLQGHELSPLVSMHLTAFTEVQLAERIFMQPGLSLQGKGVSTVEGGTNGSNGKTNMMYLEIPINLLYRFTLPNLGKLVVGGGPYAGMGLKGKEKDGSANVFRGVTGTDGYANTDFGVNLILGTELSSRLTLSVQQSIGLDNVAPTGYMKPGGTDQPYPADIKNRVASVSIGYRF